ncbi:MAG TPA: hypothetical protein VGS41_04765, partial [Chthonomonadales bacterium]|nr:hypothetical protein [Chthonomonadales bacterium]
MLLRKLLVSAPFLAFVCLAPPILAQDSSSQPKNKATGSQAQEASEAPFVFRQYSRMVNVDVVVKD